MAFGSMGRPAAASPAAAVRVRVNLVMPLVRLRRERFGAAGAVGGAAPGDGSPA